MNTKKAVFSKLFGKNTLSKTELKNLKVDLSLVGDIENEYDWLEMSYSEASYGVDFMAGISADSLVSNYSEIKSILDNADSVDTEFRNAYKEVLRASNNLPLADFS